MKHCEYKRIIEGSRRAYLFVHGIIGTPDQFVDIIDMIPEDVTLWNMLLDGHGGKVKDFSKTSMKKWEAQFESAVDELAESHDEIYVVAHSMGTLLAVEQALKNPKIVKMFFLQAALVPFVRPRMVMTAAKIIFDKIKPDDAEALAAQRCFGIERSLNLFGYIGWLPRYFELFAKMRKTVKLLPELKTPCVAFQSGRDELVAKASGKILRRDSDVMVFDMAKSGHFYYEAEDIVILRQEFAKFVRDEENDRYVC